MSAEAGLDDPILRQLPATLTQIFQALQVNEEKRNL